MHSPFIRKLQYGADLTDEDIALLNAAAAHPYPMAAKTDIISEGENPELVHLIVEGYACRYKILANGRRQIMAVFVPGDICDFHVQILGEMDHSIGTLTPASVVDIPRDTIAELIANPRINRALWWSSLVDEGTLREWLVSMGQRASAEQMAHVFCELYVRLRAVGLGAVDGFELPFTQDELSDLMGITPVHVNRTLTGLREAGLIHLDGRRLVIPDFERLSDAGKFEPNYLHLRGRKKQAPREMREGVPL
jgi:CRP-like cAMP-binding protein